jgi:TonB family protein
VVSGELHPLKRLSRRLLVRGVVLAGALHLAAFGGWLAARHMKPEPPVPELTIEVRRVTSPADLGVPPPLTQEIDASAQVAIAAAAAPSIGEPEPVPDAQATTMTIATSDQLAEALTPVDLDQLRGGQDSLVVDDSAFRERPEQPVDIRNVEQMPTVVNAPRPEYPDLARSAEIEGVVKVRVLITKEGRVAEATVIDGNRLLHEATLAAVKRWTFNPALQHNRPVPVRVDLPVRFTLD